MVAHAQDSAQVLIDITNRARPQTRGQALLKEAGVLSAPDLRLFLGSLICHHLVI